MVGIELTRRPVDVIYGVMEGATKLLTGVSRTAISRDVIHGDTYPILSYALTPRWRGSRRCIDLGLGRWRSGGRGPRARSAGALPAPRRSARPSRCAPPEAEMAGLRAALTWLAFPPVLITVSTGTTDALLAALIVAPLCVAARRGARQWAIGGWLKLAPFALVPVLLRRCVEDVSPVRWERSHWCRAQ